MNGSDLLVLIDVVEATDMLYSMSAIYQRLLVVVHSRLTKAGTLRCWRILVPKIGWRTRHWLLRVKNEVLMQTAPVDFAVGGVVQIRELRQRLLERGIGKP